MTYNEIHPKEFLNLNSVKKKKKKSLSIYLVGQGEGKIIYVLEKETFYMQNKFIDFSVASLIL